MEREGAAHAKTPQEMPVSHEVKPHSGNFTAAFTRQAKTHLAYLTIFVTPILTFL
jgi:hypothetical protein